MKSPTFGLFLFLLSSVRGSIGLIKDEKILLDRSLLSPDADGYYRLSNYDFKCLQSVAECSSNGWSLRFKMRLNSMTIDDKERQYLLFSTGAHEAYGDGILMNLVRSKPNSYLELGLKEYQTGQVSYYWHLEMDLELNQWIDMVATIKKYDTDLGQHHVLTVYLDGYLYEQTIVENFTEWSIFKYKQLHPREVIIYGNDTGLSIFEEIIYYERVLTEEEIANVRSDIVDLGCLPDDNRLHRFRITDKINHWHQCRDECFRQKMKIGLYSPTNEQCGCIENSEALNRVYPLNDKCICPLTISRRKCFSNHQWHILAVSHAIDYIDSEAGLEIQITDSNVVAIGQLRVQIDENVEIVVSVNNERNLASLTIYGDIEAHDNMGNYSKLHETYITPGVMSLSWKDEGRKTVVFRADYRRPVNDVESEYRTAYIDVVFIKTDLPLQFVYFSPDTRDGDAYQRFLVQSLGAVPINCTVDYGDGNQQTNATNRHQFYTTYFNHNYKRVGQYNVTIECTNQKSTKKAQLTRTIVRQSSSKNILIRQELMESLTASQFQLISRNDFSFTSIDCLKLRNIITNEQMKVFWKNKTLKIRSHQSLPVGKHLFQLECDAIPLQPYLLYVQSAIHSLNLLASQTVIQTGQSIDFFITLESTQDVTILFYCHSSGDIPIEISFIEEILTRSTLLVGNCTYSKSGRYQPLIRVFNHVSRINQSIQIHVEQSLAPFENSSFADLFNSTIINVKNSTYDQQILLVTADDSSIIHQAKANFTIGTDMTTSPQVYIVNSIARVNEDIVWIDIQWINGIGFHIEIEFNNEHRIEMYYEQLLTTIINRTQENIENETYWRRMGDQHVQIGFKYPKIGLYKIDVTIIQPSSKRLSIELKCSIVKIVIQNTLHSNSLCTNEEFHLSSSNSLNNLSFILLLPYDIQHNLQLSKSCLKTEFLYSYYLLNINRKDLFEEELIWNSCEENPFQLSLNIQEKSLNFGSYLFHMIIQNFNSNHFQYYIQPIEIVQSNLTTKFNDHQTILNDGDRIKLDFFSPIDLQNEQQLNFTLFCYPESNEKDLFIPKTNPQWKQFRLIVDRPELNFHFYEHQCLSSIDSFHSFIIDPETREMNLNEEIFILNNQTLYFDLMIQNSIDKTIVIKRRTINKLIQNNLTTIESLIINLDHIVQKDPKEAIEVVGDLAEKLNEISFNSSLVNDEMNAKEKNERMSLMRSKMLSSIDMIMGAVSDIITVGKAIRTTYTVTVNTEQMSIQNQEKTIDLITKIREKLFDLTSTDDPTKILEQASALMDVGNNILHAGSTFVLKEKENDPIGIIQRLDLDVKQTKIEDNNDRIRFAPTEFYDNCDDCQSLPEERWDLYRDRLQEENQLILQDRKDIARIAKKCIESFSIMADFFIDRLPDNETQIIESKSMILIFKKTSLDEQMNLTAGNTTIEFPRLADLNLLEPVITKAFQTKENPFMSINGKSNVQGDVMTIILSNLNGSELSVQNTSQPIAIRLTRPIDQYPEYQINTLFNTSFQYHQISLPNNEMTLSVHISPIDRTASDTYVVYVSYGINESTVEQPTEFYFDFVFFLPNLTTNSNLNDQNELKYTILMTPSLHRGNGTYMFGVKRNLINTTMNSVKSNSTYRIGMYVSICQYWNEQKYVWSQDGCVVGSQTTLKSTECLCNHLTTFGGDFYVPPNTINFKTVFKKFKKLHENALVFSTVIGIIGIYLIVAIWTRRADKRDLIKWTALPLIDNLSVDIFHYLITVHTGVGKESGTTSNISFVISGEWDDSGVRRLTDGKIQEFSSGSVRNFVLSVEAPLGPLLCLRVWHDNSGSKKKASWYLNMINVMDLQTGEKNYFICDNWLAVEKGEGIIDRVIPSASTEELRSFSHLFTQSMKKKLSDGHLWFSIFSRPVRSNFSRLQRLSCCISLLFCTMIANAMFYRQDIQATQNQAGNSIKIGPIQFTLTQLWISFISTLVVLPVNLIIVTLFRKAKYSPRIFTSRRDHSDDDDQIFQDLKYIDRSVPCLSRPFAKLKRKLNISNYKRATYIPIVEDKTRTFPHWTIYIAWMLIILSIITCSFFIILYSMEWGVKRANEWLVTMILSFGQSVLVIDPLKVFLITAIISFFIRQPYNDETLDFNDPFTEVLIAQNSETNGETSFNDNSCSVKEIARQRRVRLFDLKPIDPNELNQARQQRLNELKMGEIFREFAVYIIFIIVLIFLSYQSRDTNSNGLYVSTKNMFITDNFRDIDSIEKWWTYCNEDLLKGLYASEWYNGRDLTWREKLMTSNRESLRVGPARFRQLRIKDQSCRVHRRVKHVIKHCRDDYNWFDDDTKDYGIEWKDILNKTDRTEKTIRCQTPWCYQNSIRTKSRPLSAIYSTYKGGGYIISLGRNFEKTRPILADLQSQKWVDQLTRALFVEFSLYNANINLFTSVTLSIEMTSMGSIIQDYQIKIFRLYDHVGGYGVIVLVFELLFICFTIHAVFHETKLIVKQRRDYFYQFWNLHAFTTCVFSITVIGMYKTKKVLTRLAIRSLRKSEMGAFVNFNSIANFDEVYSYIVALITFLSMLKLLKLLRFDQRIGMLSKTLRYARRDLSSFAFVFLIVMLAYAQMGFILLGRSMPNFKSFPTSITTCFRMLLGEINATEMIAVGQIYGTFYFISFTFLVFIALLAVFLTILNDSFARARRELTTSNQQHEMILFMCSTFRKITGIKNNENAKATTTTLISEKSRTGAPLANIDNDEF